MNNQLRKDQTLLTRLWFVVSSSAFRLDPGAPEMLQIAADGLDSAADRTGLRLYGGAGF